MRTGIVLAPGSGGEGAPWLPVVLLIAAVAVLGYVVSRRRRRGSGHEPSVPTIDELDRLVGAMLVRTDDAIRTSEQDLELARAECGDEAVAPFAAALDGAAGRLDESFLLRTRLEDATPDDADARRAVLEEITDRLSEASESLDAHAAAFDRLRDLESNASLILDAATAVATEARSRLSQTRSSLAAMSERYASSALDAIAGNAEQAADRLELAGGAVARARERLSSGDRAGAVVAALAAEQAAASADHLMDAVDRLAADLAEADRELADAVERASRDLGEAEGLADGSHDLAGRVAAAEHALARVRRELASGTVDPIDAIKRMERAVLVLDEALADGRDDDARISRARERLEPSMLAARAEISAAADYIGTRRGAVGVEARTRLAEARRSLFGVERATVDPVAALKQAHHAHESASRALRLARSDAGAFGPDAGGVLGGGGLGSATLGGILIDTGSGHGPGSFGGIGTRARRGPMIMFN